MNIGGFILFALLFSVAAVKFVGSWSWYLSAPPWKQRLILVCTGPVGLVMVLLDLLIEAFSIEKR